MATATEERLKMDEQTAADVRLGGYYIFSAPDRAGSYDMRSPWYGRETLRQFNSPRESGQVIRINPKSITIKNITPEEWNYGHTYKIPKDAKATKDLMDKVREHPEVFKPVEVKGAPQKPTPEAKEPWKMTLKERLAGVEGVFRKHGLGRAHEEAVKQALKEGKPVPAEVLKDYPELGKGATIQPTKLTDQLDALPGIEKTYWKGDTSTLTVYYDQATGKDAANIRVQKYLTENRLRDSVKTINFLSTEKGTFKPEPKAEGKGQQRAKYNRGSWADAVRAAKALKADHNLYLFPSHGGIKIEKQAPPFGLQHIIVKPDGTHQTVSAASSFEAGRKAEEAKPKKPRKEIAALKPKAAVKQSDRAIAIDRALLARQVVSVDDPRWLKQPNRFDVRGIDTPGSGRVVSRTGFTDKRQTRMSRKHHRGWKRIKL